MIKIITSLSFVLITILSATEDGNICEQLKGEWRWNGDINQWECRGLNSEKENFFVESMKAKRLEEKARQIEIEKAHQLEIEKAHQLELEEIKRRADEKAAEYERKRLADEKAAEYERKRLADEKAAEIEQKRIAAETEKERQTICSNWKTKLEQLNGVDRIQFYNQTSKYNCK